jgi:hypothetical protein
MRYLFALSETDFKVPNKTIDSTTSDVILQLVFGVAGGIALIVLMLAALKYVNSQGDPAAVAKAKNTIIYALIGLAVAAAAFSIVSFVVKSV